jgi:hypothetical protein
MNLANYWLEMQRSASQMVSLKIIFSKKSSAAANAGRTKGIAHGRNNPIRIQPQ